MIDHCRLLNTSWRYFRADGADGNNFFRFSANGTIADHDNVNEQFWDLSGGVLTIYDMQRQPTVRFDTMVVVDGLATFSGCYVPDPTIVLCLAENRGGRWRFNDMREAFAGDIRDRNWSVGEHTYGRPRFYEEGMARFTIGRYCSVAVGVEIALGNHNPAFASTYPFAALRRYWRHIPRGAQDHTTKGDVVIGNDVWIGAGAFIGSGVRIGDGAVIGARAVVVKDVPPYGIVAGNPARLLRHRFAPAIVERLLAARWWDLDDAWVDKLTPLILSDDLGAFLDEVEAIRAAEYGERQAAE